jgi:tetratricopeptide (TPR) repeat protein
MSANDCYVVMAEACRKMARVAVRKYLAEPHLQPLGFERAIEIIFPDPVAYLSRCIRSVVSDAERVNRKEVPTVSLDQPLRGFASSGENTLHLGDTFATENSSDKPEESLLEQTERQDFRQALVRALQNIPPNYLAALQRDMARDQERQNGAKLGPETDRERQTVCRARAALSQILQRECGLDNPFVRLIAQQRSSRVRQKSSPSQNWTAERQNELLRKLMDTPWSERPTDPSADGNVEEAVVNEVGEARPVAAPSPEMRQMMRVMDTYTLGDNPTTENSEAQALYEQARHTRKVKNNLEEAIRLYKAAFDLDPRFFAAYNEVGVLLSQTGNLREALKVYMRIIDDTNAGDHRFIAATNAADIHLTWFDAGRNRERNIERALHFAQLAMKKPTPMRACNLLLSYVKDRYYVEAQKILETVLKNNLAECPSEKFLQTLFQIRDADLVAWWNWLDGELGKETNA